MFWDRTNQRPGIKAQPKRVCEEKAGLELSPTNSSVDREEEAEVKLLDRVPPTDAIQELETRHGCIIRTVFSGANE